MFDFIKEVKITYHHIIGYKIHWETDSYNYDMKNGANEVTAHDLILLYINDRIEFSNLVKQFKFKKK